MVSLQRLELPRGQHSLERRERGQPRNRKMHGRWASERRQVTQRAVAKADWQCGASRAQRP
eukprot:9049288-Pyramimonas_sp.AAC.1